MKSLIIGFWCIAILGVVVGFLILISGFATAYGSVDQIAVVMLALACALLPYMLARAVSEIVKARKGRS